MNFKPNERKKFTIEIGLVGVMMEPDNWVVYLNGIKNDYIDSKESNEISRRLFGEPMPLMPKIISQEIEKDRDQNNAIDSHNRGRIHQSGDLRPIVDTSDKNTTLSVMSVISVVSVMSVMKGLYLFNQQMIDITDQNNSFSVVSVMSVVSVVRGLYLIVRSLKIIDTSN